MRQTILAAAAAFVIGGIATGAVLSQAQPAPPPGREMGEPGPHPGMHHLGMMDWHHRMMEHRPFAPGTFALIHRQEDRQLAPADVQKIAEAFLLWNGNHTWKVTNVAATSDGPIGFSLTTPEGSVVAKFTMDPHTGRIQRIS
ncbi:MAG TPA: hypothetical protein VHU42_03905 [Rhodopila sp.]|jgi:hypothetical protein|nr:hypothetical protein [Rhodopila sp.]